MRLSKLWKKTRRSWENSAKPDPLEGLKQVCVHHKTLNCNVGRNHAFDFQLKVFSKDEICFIFS